MSESLIQCLVGGILGIGLGFLVALLLRTFSPFPASVRTWVAVMGVLMSSVVGLFFGIYPAVRASRLDRWLPEVRLGKSDVRSVIPAKRGMFK
jgi:putative ABC transport system permease protein